MIVNIGKKIAGLPADNLALYKKGNTFFVYQCYEGKISVGSITDMQASQILGEAFDIDEDSLSKTAKRELARLWTANK